MLRKYIFLSCVSFAILSMYPLYLYVTNIYRRRYGTGHPVCLLGPGSNHSVPKPYIVPQIGSYEQIRNLSRMNPSITKDTWKGQCPYPWYIPEAMQQTTWFQLFLHHLQRVDLSTATTSYMKMRFCARWWSPKPQVRYDDPPPRDRAIMWRPKPSPAPGYKRPKCKNFGRMLAPRTSCSSMQEKLWRALDDLGILYFPRAGTELGIVRGSSYLTTDGDIDIFVDMPQRQLLEKLRKVLTPQPFLEESKPPYWFKTETWWHIEGCPTIHMVFNDEMEDDSSGGIHSRRSGHTDTCECLLNSVPLSCHKRAIHRLWLMYGPSWRVPLHAKDLDGPLHARELNAPEVLRRLLSKDGVIRKDAIRDLDKCIEYTVPEMEMILAHVNVLYALITCQNDRRCLKG